MEPNPTLNKGEVCLWFEDRNVGDPRRGRIAFVEASSPEGVLTLMLFTDSGMERRVAVNYVNDPRLNDHPTQGRYSGGVMGGVWDYVVPAPRPGKCIYPDAAVEKTPEETAEKLAELRRGGMRASDAADVMTKFTGQPWTAQGVGKRWSMLPSEAEELEPVG